MTSKTIKLFLCIIITLFTMACGEKAPTNEAGLEKQRLILDFIPNTNHTGIFVALEKGYYQEEGLDLEIMQPSETSVNQLVALGKANFGISYQENLLFSRNNELPVVGIMPITSSNNSGFISLGEKNISGPEDFTGKSYCGWGSEVESVMVQEITTRSGGDGTKVQLKTGNANIFNSKKSECDFFWVYENWDIVKGDEVGLDYDYYPLGDYGIDFYSPLIIVNENFNKNNKETIRKFVEATSRGYEYAKNNPQEGAKILKKHAPEYELEFLISSQKVVSPIYAAGAPFVDSVYHDFGELLKKYGAIDSDLDVGASYTNEYLKK